MPEQIDLLREALAEKYEVEKQVGAGGMATVYRARDIRNERAVAIKVLRPELASSLGGDRFVREIRVASQLQHPNILGFYESGEAGNLLYYVMPFVEGESLRDRLNREGQLPIEDALRITREVADALGFAHAQGIVHRDIKPENILLLGGHALVADFGIAKAVEAAGGEKLTQTGMAVGTPHYMSPEQAMGGERLDGRSDMYSLGCVLYEMLAGQPPFDASTPMAIIAKHSLEQVPSLQVVRSSIPDAVEDTVLRMLEKTAADRFPGMKELVEALEDAEADVVIQRTAARRAASPQRTTARVTAASRRTTRMVAAQPGPPAWRKWAIGGAAAVVLVGGAIAAWALKGRGEGGTAAADGLDPKRLAVLYFQARVGSDSLDYVLSGLTENLIHQLSGVQQLQVISANGVAPFRNGKVGTDSIARVLKVGTVVQGKVEQRGDSLRVDVSLLNTNDQTEFGNMRLTRPRAEIAALQDSLALKVADFLRKRLGQAVQLKESRAATRSAAAWELMQRAEQGLADADTLLAHGDSLGAEQTFRRTDSLLAQASAKDDRWPAPLVARGWIQYKRSRMNPSQEPPFHAERVTRGLEFAEAALKLNPKDADALELRGTLRYWKWLFPLEPDAAKATKLFADAEADLRGAVEQNPGQASAWSTLSHLLINKPALAEAKLAAVRAYETDPYLTNANTNLWRLFSTSYQLDDAVEAKHWCEEGRQRFTSDMRFAECTLWLYSMKGTKPDPQAAWAALDRFVNLSPPSLRPLNRLKGQMRVAVALARAGLVDSAKRVAERSRGDATVDSGRELELGEALLYTVLGDKDEAFKHLSTFVASNPQVRTGPRDESWEFRSLQSDPRFAALMGGS